MDDKKFLKLTVRKSTFSLAGTVVWWKACFKGHPETVDVTMIAERRQESVKNQQKFTEVFQQANEQFVASKKNHSKIQVDE